MIVIDASATIELLRASTIGRGVAHRLIEHDGPSHAPHLLDLEVAQGLRRLVAAGEVDARRARDAVDDLARLAVVRHSHEGVLPRVWELRDNLTAYDAVYVALAEALDAPLLTLDARLARAPGHRAQVELLA